MKRANRIGKFIELSICLGPYGYGDICRAILALHEAGREVRHIDRLDKTDDLIGPDLYALIVLGGGLREVCVETHRRVLIDRGFTNVLVEPAITLTSEDSRIQTITSLRRDSV